MKNNLIKLLPYQQKWLQDNSQFKIGMFARQCGKTFINCVEIVLDCLEAEKQGKRTRWVILSRGERQAKEVMEEGIKPLCKAFFHLYNTLAPQYSESTFKGVDANYSALEVTFPSGSRITALPANPDTARGFSANLFLDEFAFHKDSKKIWESVFPIISKGYKLRVVSTPNGKGNKFYELMTSEGATWSKHVVDIYTAVEQGLERNIAELHAGLLDEDVWEQEYLLKWRDSATAWLSYDLINSVEHPDAGIPALYQGGACYVGIDIARHRDMYVVVVLEKIGDVYWLRELVALRDATFEEQGFILDRIMHEYKVARVCMDRTGMGEMPVEQAQRKYGSRIEGVLFTNGNKQILATIGKQAFEDRKVRIPQGDPVLRADLHKLRKVTSPTGAPRFVADHDSTGHADRTWALFLALNAGSTPMHRYEYTPIEKPKRFGAY